MNRTPVTRKHIARLERERRQTRLILYAFIGVLVTVLGLLLYGYINLRGLERGVATVPSSAQDRNSENITSATSTNPTALAVDGLGDNNKSYLPIAVGNTWTYSITVNPGQKLEFVLSLLVSSNQFSHYIIQSYPCGSGIYSETYTVVNQVDESTWGIRVDHEGECQGIYRGATEILWSLEPAALGRESAKKIIEHIEYDPNAPPSGLDRWPDRSLDLPTHEATILWMSNESFASKVYQVPNGIEEIFVGGSTEIETDAGLFKGCLGVLERVTDELLGGQESDSKEGWIRFSGFCPGVGLAKREQKDRDGRVVYSMMLISYKLSFR
jgi:hypothetical protein